MKPKPVCTFIRDKDFSLFVDRVIAVVRVVAPVAKRRKFEYAELHSAHDLRLDFDVTVLPPKLVFFPPTQDILRFDGDDVVSCIDPVDTVLFGVHPYDVKGIDMADRFFSKPNADGDYLSQRARTVVVASNIQNLSPENFSESIARDVAPKGMDAFLTKIAGGYTFETCTERGAELTCLGAFVEASAEQIKESKQVNDSIMEHCSRRVRNTSDDIARVMAERFDDKELWQGLADGCFSCGSCNLVCPTCFCFDVKDRWNADQASGVRSRCWDSCLAYDFSVTTLVGGGEENFRGEHFERFRHRFMRKTVYQRDVFDGPACVGCGRCSAACTPGIADPVAVINTVMG